MPEIREFKTGDKIRKSWWPKHEFVEIVYKSNHWVITREKDKDAEIPYRTDDFEFELYHEIASEIEVPSACECCAFLASHLTRDVLYCTIYEKPIEDSDTNPKPNWCKVRKVLPVLEE